MKPEIMMMMMEKKKKVKWNREKKKKPNLNIKRPKNELCARVNNDKTYTRRKSAMRKGTIAVKYVR